MRESFLHYLWRTRRFDHRELLTTEGQPIEIQYPGEQNTHAGPDFFNARLCLDGTLWAGNVEMHLKSSEWLAHGHNADPAYDSVVLHVVLKEDFPVLRQNGGRIPCLELEGRIPPRLLESYERLEQEQDWIPCKPLFAEVPAIIKSNWLDRLMVERLEMKTSLIETALLATENHWDEAFYRLLAHNFGLKVNAEPFETLARCTPLRLLARHKTNLAQLEALLFGQAGLLQRDFQDDWPQLLAREYRHLQHKYGLIPMDASFWKFLRLRPANFPTVRIAQFAALMQHATHLYSNILEINHLKELYPLFSIHTSCYWNDHYQFDKASVTQEKLLGKPFVNLLAINTIAPFLFHYGKIRQVEIYQKRALALLESIPPEENHLLEGWAGLGQKAVNAFQSQALIQLKTRYCDGKRCLECAIGNAVLK